MIKQMEIFFTGLSEMSSGIPTLLMVPLIMILAAIGTIVIVKILRGFICLLLSVYWG